MKKVIILNASPRKNFNTARLLKNAQQGALKAGADVEYIDLVNLNYKGCISCFACKRKGSTTNGLCAYKDELRPVLENILQADSIIIGTPVYFSYPTSLFRAFVERLMFPCYSYLKDEVNGGVKRIINKYMPIGLIYTMNCSMEDYKERNYPVILGDDKEFLKKCFGYCEVINAYYTLQFDDYSKYDSNLYDINHKKKYNEENFPKYLELAFDLGKRLAEIK